MATPSDNIIDQKITAHLPYAFDNGDQSNGPTASPATAAES